MSNYSILQRNTLGGLSEAAGVLYLRLVDQYQGDERRAFFDACRFEERCAATLDYVLRRFPGFRHVSDQVKSDLSRFFAERWRNNFMERAALQQDTSHG